MSTIQDLERKVQSLRDQLRVAEDSLEKAKIATAPVKVGDIVRSNGKLFKVSRVEPKWGDVYWVGGNPERKDGTFSNAWGRNLYSYWEKVEQPAPAQASQ